MPQNAQNLHQPTYSHLHPGLDAESLRLESFAGRPPYPVLFLVSRRVSCCPHSALLSGRSAAWLARLVRDQEVEGSNPFAPTNLLESATYKMRKSIERLVQG